MICPGIGTTIGAVLGGLAGGFVGGWGFSKIFSSNNPTAK